MANRSIAEVPVRKINGTNSVGQQDQLAVEEPLEIRLGFLLNGRRERRSISITMRTPGHDFELAAGFLFTESIIREPGQIERTGYCGPPVGTERARNVVRVDLREGVTVDFKRLERHFYTSSSCGVCGKSSIEALQLTSCPIIPESGFAVDAEVVHRLPETLRASQSVFTRTGGLHAAALFDARGQLLAVREDVGRHNAVDKLIGAHFTAGQLPLHERLILVSGRASFELMQKALAAGIPLLAAVGAPSSLAVEVARNFNMTLLGFVRDDRFNIYSGAHRVRGVALNETHSLQEAVEV